MKFNKKGFSKYKEDYSPKPKDYAKSWNNLNIRSYLIKALKKISIC